MSSCLLSWLCFYAYLHTCIVLYGETYAPPCISILQYALLAIIVASELFANNCYVIFKIITICWRKCIIHYWGVCCSVSMPESALGAMSPSLRRPGQQSQPAAKGETDKWLQSKQIDNKLVFSDRGLARFSERIHLGQ